MLKRLLSRIRRLFSGIRKLLSRIKRFFSRINSLLRKSSYVTSNIDFTLGNM